MQNTAYLLVFDGLADWEPAHILCELRKSGQYVVKTAAFTPEPVTTMGGITILPDVTIDEIEAADTAVFILPGGRMWEQQGSEPLQALLRQLQEQGVPLTTGHLPLFTSHSISTNSVPRATVSPAAT